MQATAAAAGDGKQQLRRVTDYSENARRPTGTTISAKLYERRCPNPLQNAEAAPRGKCHKRKRSGSPRNARDHNDTTNDNTDNLLIPTASPLDRRMRKQDVVAEPTCAGEADTDPTAASTSWNPPVWNHHENSRAARSSLDDTPDDNYNPLFEDSQIQLELISQRQDNTGDGYDAVIDRGEANSPQLEARDEELQDLVDKVQQLLITTPPDSEAIRRDSGDGLAGNTIESPVASGSAFLQGDARSSTPQSQGSARLSRRSDEAQGRSHATASATPSSQLRNTSMLDDWVRRPCTRSSDNSSNGVTSQAYDCNGFLLPSATGVQRFTREHSGFVDRSSATSPSSNSSPRGFGVEWIYHGLYSWNLRRRLEREDYLTTDDVLCGMRLAIELSGRRDVTTLARAIHLGEPQNNSIQLSQAEIEDIRRHDATILSIFRPGIEEGVGHWSLAIYQPARPHFLFCDSLGSRDDCYYSALRDIHDSVLPDSAPASICDVPITRQVNGWTCGVIVVECARRFLTAREHYYSEDLMIEDQPGLLDWTQQEPYLSEMQDPDLREVGAISYWIEVISQYLGATTNHSATSIGSRRSSSNDAVTISEPADPALLLFQEWSRPVGCTSRQHEEDHSSQLADATTKRGVSPNCSSLLDIAKRLEGVTGEDSTNGPLPCVLDPAKDLLRSGTRESSSPDAGLTRYGGPCKAAMEGLVEGEQDPPYLCMHSNHSARRLEDDRISSSYDIDSLCSFPTSLGVARLGIQWYTQSHVTLNLVDNVHLSMEIPGTREQDGTVTTQPLHTIPNYCLGRVIGLADTFIWAFFPALFSGKLSDPYSQTCIPKKNFVHWYEEVMLPAIQAVVDDNNILQYIPKTHAIASSDCSAPREALAALAVAEEEEADMEEELDGFTGAKRRDGPAAQPGSRRKHFYVTLQSRYLAALWEEIHSRAALWPEYAGLRLYMAAKNTKLTWMRPTFESALAEWQHHWNSAVDEAYIDPEVTYIDIGRQMTPADTGPHGRVLIWRRCCMDRLWRRRLQWSRIQNRLYHREEDACKDESGKRQAPPIRRTTYPFVTLRDARDMTITPSSSSWELRNGLVYSQFYNLIKVPFDAAKQYPFQNRHTESMALDPSYLRDQRNSTRGAHAHQSRVQCAYRLSKLRIHRNVPAVDQDDDDDDDDEIHHEESTHHPFTYGIRAEDRVSLALLRRITGLFSSSPPQDGSGDDEEDEERDHPFFSVSSQTMARFLRASVNRYCFLFEYVKSQTGLKYSLPETVVMAAALRGLRFSYDCSLIAKEAVLWGDRWTSTQRVRVEGGEARIVKVEREGLGLNKTSTSHGFGWWLPGKFDWSTWRFASDVGDRLAVGNDLLRQDYKRQWRVLKDIRDVHVRMWQAQSWLGRYRVQDDGAAKRLWLEYLHSTVIELFQRDVWRAALRSVSWKTGSDVTDEASMRYPESSPPSFCYDTLSDLFHDRQHDTSHTRPHLVAGNKIRSTSMKDLFDDLFSPSSTGTTMKRRRGWASLPYRIATRRSIELVEMVLGAAAATQWYAQLRRIVLLTHWILPWPSDTELLTTTKESRATNLKRRLTWASVVHITPSSKSTGHVEPAVPTRKVNDADRQVSTQDDLSQLLSEVCRRRFGDKGWASSADNTKPCYHWSTGDLISSTRNCVGIDTLRLGRAVGAYNRGCIFPVVENGHPPQLRMVTRIRDKTLDELSQVFSELLEVGNVHPSSLGGSITPEIGQSRVSFSRSATWQAEQEAPRGPAAQSRGFRYLQLLARKRPRTAEERERLRRHFRRRDCVRAGKVVVGTDSIHSDDTGSSAQTEETDQSWRPQKRLRKAVRDQMIVRLE
ncbi:hypothetical protein Forpi1262_v018817 [Fusarium oxysporum f. sp. raphani]|uniref:Ubiquitin-like protease family profile domain-containing protein n=1 Tax=Fusarium oxysporum f. sp. raphani TaxID=96318 RepID=A0A8J5NFT5_FUSOX|nr:hypothetical protein Forpi1262_v018817 [Fusarium oxysporum f. sp. raphani]